MIKSSDDRDQWDQRTEAKQDHAGMRQMLHEDELTKIAVVGDENSLLPVRNAENVAVGQTRRVMPRHSRDIVDRVLNPENAASGPGSAPARAVSPVRHRR